MSTPVRPATTEKAFEAIRLENSFSVYRLGGGLALTKLCSALDSASSPYPAIEVHSTDNDAQKQVRLDLAKAKEIDRNEARLDRLSVEREDCIAELEERQPRLFQPRLAIVDAVDNHTAYYGAHYLSLQFHEISAEQIVAERRKLWENLGEIAGAGKDGLLWTPYIPDMKIVHTPPALPPTFISKLEEIIVSHLPFALELSPVFPIE